LFSPIQKSSDALSASRTSPLLLAQVVQLLQQSNLRRSELLASQSFEALISSPSPSSRLLLPTPVPDSERARLVESLLLWLPVPALPVLLAEELPLLL
jgi:hypothetical protein